MSKPINCLPHGEKTDPAAYYHIRNMNAMDTLGNGGWYGTRRNGRSYHKLWQLNSNEYKGGEKLDAALADKPHLRAVRAEDHAARRRKRGKA